MFAKDGSYAPNREVWKPLGVLYLAAAVEKEGISVSVLDMMPREGSLDAALNLIRKTAPRVVGITGTTLQVRGMVQLGRAIKKQFGDEVTLAVGGPHASCDPGLIEAFSCFDLALIGEGELTFPGLVKKVLEGAKVRGVIRGDSPQDLDTLPYPARHLLKDAHYPRGPHGARYASIHTTRGCPFRCIYCSSPVEQLSKVRFRSFGSVVDEIENCIRDFSTEFFIFTDDTFTLKRERVEAICREILRRGLDIRWNCDTRANLVDRNLLSLMKEAGCREMFFGVESGSERIRNEIIKKRVDDRDIYQAFQVCRELGITTNAFLMAGFPTETNQELRETWNFCFRAEPDVIGIHLTGILPGAPIFAQAVREGRIQPDVWHRYARGEVKDQPIYVPDGLTLAELEAFQRNLYHRFYFRLSWLRRRLRTSLTSWYQLRSDLRTAWQLLTRGKSKARSYREEDYF